jgi:hypothetical protein
MGIHFFENHFEQASGISQIFIFQFILQVSVSFRIDPGPPFPDFFGSPVFYDPESKIVFLFCVNGMGLVWFCNKNTIDQNAMKING